jgi:hypothetical protein
MDTVTEQEYVLMGCQFFRCLSHCQIDGFAEMLLTYGYRVPDPEQLKQYDPRQGNAHQKYHEYE